MINALHLLYMLPICFISGFMLCALFTAGKGGGNNV